MVIKVKSFRSLCVLLVESVSGDGALLIAAGFFINKNP